MILRDNGLSLYDAERQARRYRVKRAFASFSQQVHPDMTYEIVVSSEMHALLEDNFPEVLAGALGIRVRLEPSLSGTVAHAIGPDGTRRHTFAMRLPGSSLTGAPPQGRARRYRAFVPVFIRRLLSNLRPSRRATREPPTLVVDVVASASSAERSTGQG